MDDQNRMDGIQSAAGDIGLVLRKAVAFEHGLGGEEKRKQLAEIGRRLRNIEIEHIYSDGGESVRKVFEGIRAAEQDLTALVVSLDGKEAAPAT